MQASGDMGNVDVQINGKSVANNLGWRQTFPTPTTSYSSVKAGTVHYQEFATGTASPALVDTQLGLSAKTFYTIITAGEESSGTVGTILLTDDHVAPAAGELRVRFVNAASTLGPVDLSFTSGSNGLPPPVPALGYKSSTSYLSFTGTSIQLCVNWAGAALPGGGLSGVGNPCPLTVILQFKTPPQNSMTFVIVDPPSVPPDPSQSGGFTLTGPTFASLPF